MKVQAVEVIVAGLSSKERTNMEVQAVEVMGARQAAGGWSDTVPFILN